MKGRKGRRSSVPEIPREAAKESIKNDPNSRKTERVKYGSIVRGKV